MPLNPDAVGSTSEPVEVSWTSKERGWSGFFVEDERCQARLGGLILDPPSSPSAD